MRLPCRPGPWKHTPTSRQHFKEWAEHRWGQAKLAAIRRWGTRAHDLQDHDPYVSCARCGACVHRRKRASLLGQCTPHARKDHRAQILIPDAQAHSLVVLRSGALGCNICGIANQNWGTLNGRCEGRPGRCTAARARRWAEVQGRRWRDVTGDGVIVSPQRKRQAISEAQRQGLVAD